MKTFYLLIIIVLFTSCKHFDAKVTEAYQREPYSIESSHTESVRTGIVGNRCSYEDVQVTHSMHVGRTFNLHIVDKNGEWYDLGLPTKDSLKFAVGDSIRAYQEAIFGGVVKVNKLN